MRLLNTSTLSLHEFVGDNIPSYAILSHRWEGEEVTFQDLQSGRGPEMAGHSKIRGCCAQAALDRFDYAWIDSCCIDKTSSSELSEAINSMFNWYRKAQVCYAYLSDVPAGGFGEDHLREGSHFRRSEWFTRGWTLQELLAPRSVVFFDSDWVDIGTRHSLRNLVSAITGVKDMDDFKRACVAQKMSWASRRRTTRIEDQAYCLMGLFGVNMPPLYGEGSKAFYRLQLEILKGSDDESLFAWTDQRDYGDDLRGSILATSPAAFSDSGDVMRESSDPQKSEFTMTNKGLRMELLLPKEIVTSKEVSKLVVAPLDCSLGGRRLGIQLKRAFHNRFQRLPPPSHITFDYNEHKHKRVRTLVYVQNPLIFPYSWDTRACTFEFTTGNFLEHGFGFPGTLFVGSPKHSQARVEDITSIKFTLAGFGVSQEFVTFLSKKKAWKKGFTVFLQVKREGVSISLLIPAYSTFVDRWGVFDRVSAPLYSGMSVNVAVKERDEGLERKCVVAMNIDPEGKLRWHSSKPERLNATELGFDVSQWS